MYLTHEIWEKVLGQMVFVTLDYWTYNYESEIISKNK